MRLGIEHELIFSVSFSDRYFKFESINLRRKALQALYSLAIRIRKS